MILPLGMTIWFSLIRFSLLNGMGGFVGLLNYRYFISDPAFLTALLNTLVFVGSVLVVSIVAGTVAALIMDQPIFGRGLCRLMIISPFFVMPTVGALLWKNLLMDPVSGLFAFLASALGIQPFDWFARAPMFAIIIIVSWQWIPFAALIILTALQSIDDEQKEAAEMDGARIIPLFIWIVAPHIARAITVVVLVETIFLLSVFAEILVTTNGGPGLATTTLAFLVYTQGLLGFDVGEASAGGVIAVILANIVAIFLIRMIGKNLEG